MSRVYLSGPMTGIHNNNFEEFADTAQLLRDQGHVVVSPHEINPDDTEGTWADWIRRDLLEMLTCDSIYMLPNWRFSRGATLELYVATQVGMDVIW